MVEGLSRRLLRLGTPRLSSSESSLAPKKCGSDLDLSLTPTDTGSTPSKRPHPTQGSKLQISVIHHRTRLVSR
ncbi:glutamate-gated kainate-type ion channel receptor subunit GluR5 [Corchorus olitorius]|uniref:Glutamate-gated kainate-type ion channel receptor subunit GluR5 n=1 Tax=Corchorus olitorius TaxID=93759 RepID=A0A1R3G047_9ROSI|nr:glutamate-gated kainate-type ion channel receptor subunit GluR5 [Corchorus olitorius]